MDIKDTNEEDIISASYNKAFSDVLVQEQQKEWSEKLLILLSKDSHIDQ